VKRPQIGIEEQLRRLDVDGRLAATAVAHGPFRIDQTPKRRS
jgi:hypothetical protein